MRFLIIKKNQPCNTLSKESGSDSMGRHRTTFSRVRHLMPERDRLASNLSRVAHIRSEEGREVLCNIIVLYQQQTEVAFCPGLEPEKCSCLVVDDKQKLDR